MMLRKPVSAFSCRRSSRRTMLSPFLLWQSNKDSGKRSTESAGSPQERELKEKKDQLSKKFSVPNVPNFEKTKNQTNQSTTMSSNITTEQVKELRDQTGISVMQCRKALEEAGGDKEKAMVILRKKSGELAAKKGDRTFRAGVIQAYVH